MNEILTFWAQWLRPSAGLPTVQWSLLLAVAAMVGYLTQRHTGLPKVLGYSLVGTAAGLAGFSGAVWPLQGIGLFLLELGIALVLFECGGRIPLRWFRHNPMVLVQSIAESALTYFAVYWVLVWLDMPAHVAGPLALVALAASPAVLTRVVADNRAAGPVTERAIVVRWMLRIMLRRSMRVHGSVRRIMLSMILTGGIHTAITCPAVCFCHC